MFIPGANCEFRRCEVVRDGVDRPRTVTVTVVSRDFFTD
jgi:C4-type Zn-finger protein